MHTRHKGTVREMGRQSPSIDELTDRQRYETRAQALLKDRRSAALEVHSKLCPTLEPPYDAYYQAIRSCLPKCSRVLELGSGTGRHSGALCAPNVATVCSDTSASALEVLATEFRKFNRKVDCVTTAMEATPFADSSFDLVASAGSLSYADPLKLDDEISRVLKSGGSFICVDSMNHNPVFRFNRWVRWRMIGDRTRQTLVRMPTLDRMTRLGRRFSTWSLRGYGAYVWLWSPLSRALGPTLAAKCNNACDRLPGSRYLAFKFVFEAHGLKRSS